MFVSETQPSFRHDRCRQTRASYFYSPTPASPPTPTPPVSKKVRGGRIGGSDGGGCGGCDSASGEYVCAKYSTVVDEHLLWYLCYSSHLVHPLSYSASFSCLHNLCFDNAGSALPQGGGVTTLCVPGCCFPLTSSSRSVCRWARRAVDLGACPYYRSPLVVKIEKSKSAQR